MSSRYSFASLPSTQRHAVRLARQGAPAGTRVVAATQSAGVGRLDHRWQSPLGGLYLSVLSAAAEDSGSVLPLAVGLELSRSLRDTFRVHLAVKWPNDLLLERDGETPGKLAGILVDRVAAPSGASLDVVGIGINANGRSDDFPGGLRRSAATLEEVIGRKVDLRQLEELTVLATNKATTRTSTLEGRASTIEELTPILHGRGCPVRLDGRPIGVLSGLSSDGSLEVASGEHRTIVRAGELEILEGA